MMLQDISIFGLASTRMEWLTLRQQTVAQNVANADTPGYKAREISSFGDVLSGEMRATGLEATDPRHLGASSSGIAPDVFDDPTSVDEKMNGNTVSVEREAIKADAIASDFSMAINLYRKSNELLTLAISGRR